MVYTGINMGQVKLQNRSVILNCINESGPVSRKDIAQITGLTPAAVTQICNYLMEQGLLVETGIKTKGKGAGRRKVLLDLNYDGFYVLSITMEPEETVVALCNIQGRLVEQIVRKTQTDIAPKEFITLVAEDCHRILNNHPEEESRLLGASVGITGLVDRQKGVSLHAYGIWEEEVAIRDLFMEELDITVVVENNVNAFAMAEILFGLGTEYDNLVVVKWGPGVGSTIVMDHRIYEGRHGKAAEIGHFIVESGGLLCSCGRRGCLETKVSHQALSSICSFAPEEFGRVYEASFGAERAAFDKAIDLFARTIVNTTTLLAPNRVVLTGNMFYSELVRKELISRCNYYDNKLDEHRILYTGLAEKEHYIGPVATFVQEEIFG